jgi:hypothetical protein
MKNIKKDIIGVKHISVSIGEISYFRINQNENNFMGSLYDYGLSIFSNELSFK